VFTPENPNAPEVLAQLRLLKPDFLFSFYYRHMLKPEVLALAPRGALNMHGSLLPRYRGRVPINWAVINGETETGATLHYMVEKPDAGDIVDQQAVPILADDTALDVFRKVTQAAETVLQRSLPALIAGNAPRIAQNLAAGNYCGGRKPEDGRIDWQWPALRVHNLVRGVAPPYPGAFAVIGDKTLRVLKTRPTGETASLANTPALYWVDSHCYAACGDRQVLELLEIELNGAMLTAADFEHAFGSTSLNLQ
jgi:methionyl-tRNA formyltransferase